MGSQWLLGGVCRGRGLLRIKVGVREREVLADCRYKCVWKEVRGFAGEGLSGK